ncbi:MAG TPA: endolytic transglycosylase MltG [Sphingomicrobium sp.]
MRRLAGAAILLILAALVAIWGLWLRSGDNAKPVPFTVEQGASIASVASQLEAKGLIGSATTFRGFARLFGGGDPVQAGEFEIPARASPSAILDLLQHGRPIQRLITVTEGMPAVIVEERLAANQYLTGPVPTIAEGSVLPDSYSFERGEARQAVVARMQSAMTRTLDSLWAGRKPTCPITSKQEAIVLASIVEKETGKPSERRTVAGVYCNRLRIGMKLDADPTVIYPITKGKPLGRRIRRSELMAETGYNTYRSPGLPIGPIANPGRDSIAAVLDPAPTEAIYFVADGTGGHVFAKTFAEHQANVQKWYAIRRARGEM